MRHGCVRAVAGEKVERLAVAGVGARPNPVGLCWREPVPGQVRGRTEIAENFPPNPLNCLTENNHLVYGA